MKRYELSLTDYWLIIRKRKLVIILTFVCLTAASALYTLRMEPIYEATSTVRIADVQTTYGPTPSITMMTSMREMDPVGTEAQAILGLPVLKRAALALGWVNENTPQEEVIYSVNSLRSWMETDVVKTTNMIDIIVHNPDPALAAAIANATAEAYVQEDYARKVKEARAVRKDVEAQLRSVEAELQKNEEDIVSLRKEGEAIGLARALQEQLMKLETQRSELLSRYTEKLPEVRGLTEQIDDIKEKLKALPEDEVALDRGTRGIEALSDVYKDLTAKLSQARIAEAENVEEVQIIDPAVVPTKPVSPNLPLNIGIGAGSGVILGFLLAFLIENIDTSLVAIEAVEELTGLTVLGVIPYIRKPRLKRGKKDPKKKLRIKRRIRNLRFKLTLSLDTEAHVVEAFKSLRTNIQLRTEKKGRNLILITSSSPSEGKTVIVANLAIAMAQNKIRTLLVDADLRRPAIHSLFGIEREPGFSDVLLGSSNLENSTRTLTDLLMGDLGWTEILQFRDLDYLDIITCGSPVSNSSELFNAAAITKFLENIKAKYDVVFFDSPPALVVTDPFLLGTKVEEVILVYKAGKTPKNALLRTIEQFRNAGASVLGIVLNTVKPQVRYYPQYHYEYSSEPAADKGAVS